MSANTHSKLVRKLRWIVRILASIMATLILLIFVGETLDEGVQSLLIIQKVAISDKKGISGLPQ